MVGRIQSVLFYQDFIYFFSGKGLDIILCEGKTVFFVRHRSLQHDIGKLFHVIGYSELCHRLRLRDILIALMVADLSDGLLRSVIEFCNRCD